MLTPSIFNNNFVEDMFDNMFGVSPFKDDFASFGGFFGNNNLMNTDIEELENGYQLDLELPGYDKKDIQAELKDGYLTINAKHSDHNEEKDENGHYIRRERYQGECRRSFYVGENITQEDIKASFENGVLKLTIPKKEEAKVEDKKYIAIEG